VFVVEHELGTIKVEAEITGENRDKIESLSDVRVRYNDLGRKQKEHLYAVYLTNSNEEIGDELLSLGTTDSASLNPKQLVRTAALVNAGAVILIHNHPSGQPKPTNADIESTEKIHETLEQLGITLLDHVIITHQDHHSMKQNQDGPF
jgi:DNA repair protein RadC